MAPRTPGIESTPVGDSSRPSLPDGEAAHAVPLLSPCEAARVIAAAGELGQDPSSTWFTPRRKSIAYLMRIGAQWFQLRADYFVQPCEYNDFSGGYRRHFTQLDAEFTDEPAVVRLLDAFAEANGIGEQDLVLVQVQTSIISDDDPHRSLTGQGIHTDGHDRAMIVCLERNNIVGAENAIHAELDGSVPILQPFVLDEGSALFWHDNEVFHDVSAARPLDARRPASRTVLLAHHPATQSLTGEHNPNNELGATPVAPERRLRHRDDLAR